MTHQLFWTVKSARFHPNKLPGVAGAWEMLVGKHLVSGKQAHDAHLVAVMLVYAVTSILTFNIADFQRYPGITVLDPAQF